MRGEADPHHTQLTDRLKQANILIVDDEPGMRNFLVKALSPYCGSVVEAAAAAEAGELLDRQHFDVVILDNKMPGKRGIDWLSEQRSRGGISDTILVTAYADLETAIEAMRAGAADFVLKPFRTNQLLNAVRRCMQMAQLRRENALLRHELGRHDGGRRRSHLIGSSAGIEDVRATLGKMLNVSTPVLITGASGTGKEVAARYLHAASERASAPFVPIDCATIPAERIETELFGHVRGAFPGADEAREGLLASAQGGTVFFDEVAELHASAQSALLRVLEDGVIRPLGSTRTMQLDARFIFATSRALAKKVPDGHFREDLFFRMNVLEIRMPPLSQRENDVIDLAEMFIRELAPQLGLPPLAIGRSVRTAMLRHAWPGNIRELRNFIERSLIFGRFPLETLRDEQDVSIETLEDVERRQILAALEAMGGNRSKAARKLGISRKTIDRKCAAWGI